MRTPLCGACRLQMMMDRFIILDLSTVVLGWPLDAAYMVSTLVALALFSSVCLSLSVCLCLSACLFVLRCLSLSLMYAYYFWLAIYRCLPGCCSLWVCLSVYVPICLSVSLLMCVC